MKQLFKKMSERFDAGEPVVLATVISRKGSTPRKPGAKMAFFRNGSNKGTVGGGALEAAVEKLAVKIWQSRGAVIKNFGLHDNITDGIGMVCGGDQQVLLAWLAPNPSHREVLQRLLLPENLARPICLATRLQGSGPEYGRADLYLLDRQSAPDQIEIDQAIVASLRQKCRERGFYLSEPANDTLFIVEMIHPRPTLFLFGAGHVARPVVEIASLVGFRTVVLDDRQNFASREHFPKADDLIVLQDFNHPLESLSLPDDAFVVIMTRGHALDQNILEQVLGGPAAYIGMIGSRSKVAHCFRALKDKGIGPEKLARVHAPIGLDIGSETPEEIAVSIVAQLIQVRSQLKVA